MKETKVEIKKEVSIPEIRIGKAIFPIIAKAGTTLVMDRMPTEVLQQIEDKQKKTGRSSNQARNIDIEIKRAQHLLPNGKIGFPAGGFKSGMIEATSFVGDKSFSKKLIKGIQITNAVSGLIPIKYKKQDVLKHNVGSNTKYSPQFHDWSCDLEIQFDMNNISEQDIATLINYAGFSIGIGSWSPRCKSGGEHGMYELKTGKRK